MVSRGIINDSMEFETLPVSQGDVLVRGPSRPVRGGAPDGPGGAPSQSVRDGMIFAVDFIENSNKKGPLLVRQGPLP